MHVKLCSSHRIGSERFVKREKFFEYEIILDNLGSRKIVNKE